MAQLQRDLLLNLPAVDAMVPSSAWPGTAWWTPSSSTRRAAQRLVRVGHTWGSAALKRAGQSQRSVADRNAPELILAGFDAGQTHTRCRLAWLMADIGQGEGSGVSHLGSSDGPERFAEALRSSLTAARQNTAATGTQRRSHRLRQHRAGQPEPESCSCLARQPLDLIPLWSQVMNTQLAGAFAPGQPGIVLIGGTGAIAVGRDSSGRQHRCAGWGWLVDGVGSAMDIGETAWL